MREPKGSLTAAQYEIMDAVWNAGEEGVSVADIWQAISQARAIGRTTVRQRSVVEALRMLMELARGPQPPVKPRRETMSRLRPRVARTPRRSAVKRRRPTRT